MSKNTLSPQLFWLGVFLGPVSGAIAVVLLVHAFGIGGSIEFPEGVQIFPALLRAVVTGIIIAIVALPASYIAMNSFRVSFASKPVSFNLTDFMSVGFKAARNFAITIVLLIVGIVFVHSFQVAEPIEAIRGAFAKAVGGFFILGIVFLFAWTLACVGVLFGAPLTWIVAKKLKLVSIED